MGYGQAPKIKQEECAIVLISATFLSRIIVAENQLFRPGHGLRNVKMHTVVFDTDTNKLCALISSSDVPAYVGLHRYLEDLAYYKLNGTSYPLVGLEFEVLTMLDENPDEEGMWHGAYEDGM